MEVPEHPLDRLVNYFGTENVAEMTGRKKRPIRTLSEPPAEEVGKIAFVG